jgi:hypothetical protein
MIILAQLTLGGNFFIEGKSAEFKPFSTVSQDNRHRIKHSSLLINEPHVPSSKNAGGKGFRFALPFQVSSLTWQKHGIMVTQVDD